MTRTALDILCFTSLTVTSASSLNAGFGWKPSSLVACAVFWCRLLDPFAQPFQLG